VVTLGSGIAVEATAVRPPGEDVLRALGEPRNLSTAPGRLRRALETAGARP
jgi:hypothetical protein